MEGTAGVFKGAGLQQMGSQRGARGFASLTSKTRSFLFFFCFFLKGTTKILFDGVDLCESGEAGRRGS